MEGAAAATAKPTGEIVSMGQPIKADMTMKQFTPGEEKNDGNGGETPEQKTIREASEARELLLKSETPEAKVIRETAEAEAAKNTLPDLSNEQTNKLLAKALGIENFDGNIDALKEKLKPATVEQTTEEKEATEKAFENRMVEFFLKNGGTAEQFAAFKAVASTDLRSLSVDTIKREMKADGFDEDEIAVVLKERFFQLNPDELQKEDDEDDDVFEKRKEKFRKKVEYGSKQLDNYTAPLKRQAEQALISLRNAIKESDLEKQEEIQTSSKVEEIGKTVPRKMTFNLGKVNDKDIAPIDYVVTENDIAEVVAELKDSEKRKQIYLNSDDSLNLTSLFDLRLKNKILETALKAAYLEGSDRQVSAFEKVFPGTAHSLGVGGNGKNNSGKPGQIVSAGTPQPMTVKAK